MDSFGKFLGRARGIESLAEESTLFKESYISLNLQLLEKPVFFAWIWAVCGKVCGSPNIEKFR
jgi:hypothetical protein